MDLSAFVVVAGLGFVLWMMVSRFRSNARRLDEVELTLQDLSDPQPAIAALEGQIRALEKRVVLLEGAAPQPSDVPSRQPAAIPLPSLPPVVPPVVTGPAPPEIRVPIEVRHSDGAPKNVPTNVDPRPPEAAFDPRPLDAAADPRPVQPANDPRPPVAAIDPRPLADRDKPHQDWEAVIGGNWLNKIGVFVLVIGISLFLGYSLTQLGPAGRVAIGLAASALLLGVGVVFERKPGYTTFGRGLIGGGWAGIYFTTYAMHGLDAARIVTSPFVATLALALVAAGMILHSLRYRSQVVTGLAYFIGFATLAITPVTTFSIAATLPLAASLLVVAQRFQWTPMAVVGLVATYGTYLIASGPAPATGMDQFIREQLLLALYWLMFEAFDLLSERQNARGQGHRMLFPLNVCGFVGVSLLRWSSFAPEMLYAFFAISAAAYLTSAVARALLLRGSRDPIATISPPANTSYRLPVTVGVTLVVPAIVLRFSGLQFNLAFLLASEFLFFSGLQFGDGYLRWLAAIIMGVPVLKSAVIDLPLMEQVAVGTWTMMRATPTAAVTAGLLYLNRALVSRWARSGAGVRVIALETIFRAAAATLIALIVGYETRQAYVGAAWLVLSLAIFEIGVRTRLPELRTHAYVIGALGLVGAVAVNVVGLRRGVWLALSLDTALAYLWVARLAVAGPTTLSDAERRGCAAVSACAGSLFAAALIWAVVPVTYLGPAWLLWAWALLEVGLWSRLAPLRYQAYAIAVLAVATLLTDAFPSTVNPRLLLTVVGTGSVLLWAAFARVFRLSSDRLPDAERTIVRDLSAAFGTVLLGALAWQLLPVPVVAIGWGVMGLLLLDVGFALSVPSLRLYGHTGVGFMLIRLVMTNLPSDGSIYSISHRVLTIAPTIASLYFAGSWLKTIEETGKTARWERGLARAYLWAGTLVAVLLIGFEFDRTVATSGWAVLALGLLALGRRSKNHDLWWQSHLVAILAFVRSWATDFYVPESLGGSSARIATGAIVIASFYVAQLLSSGGSAAGSSSSATLARPLEALERHGRTTFSVMATALLARLLFNELSAGLLTIGWSVQGVVLLASGFLAGDRILRRSGLLLLAVCTTKAMAYDFRVLDTLSRIFSFIVLGILLLVTSWVYARYGDRLRRYL